MSVISPCWSLPAALLPPQSVRLSRMKAPEPLDLSAVVTARARADAELLGRSARGDREAFAELYDRFSRPLYATALRITANPTEAEDVVQEVFVTLWEKARAFEDSRGSAFAWAVTLTRNRAIDRVRQRNRRTELLSETTAEDAGT
ncbi:MAG TPA: sigma-70 family RNA polymerase sigma factor, partial [Opitutaceae bacterium]|nr:sigma-70 family RNA polymerase sigma factor [Opitutaceae bacterium]